MSITNSSINQRHSSISLRRLIDKALVTDGDLDAFCLDYFFVVKRRFTSGMDRVQKVNLLLELADSESLCSRLSEYLASRRARAGQCARYAPPGAFSHMLPLKISLGGGLFLLAIIFGMKLHTSPTIFSDPPNALIVHVASGYVLGRTPLSLDALSAGLPRRPLRVCLRLLGFRPEPLLIDFARKVDYRVSLRPVVDASSGRRQGEEDGCVPVVD